MIYQLSHIIMLIQSFAIWFKMLYFMDFLHFFLLLLNCVAYSDIDPEVYTY